jgi:hypothetical protein
MTINEKLFRQVFDHLRDDPTALDAGAWVRTGLRGGKEHISGCIAGWALMLSGYTVDKGAFGVTYLREPVTGDFIGGEQIPGKAAELLGIEWSEEGFSDPDHVFFIYQAIYRFYEMTKAQQVEDLAMYVSVTTGIEGL